MSARPSSSSPEPLEQAAAGPQWPLLLGVGGIALLATVMVTIAVSPKGGPLAQFPQPTNSVGAVAAVQLDARGKRIASGLYCACGCPDLLLACDCGNRAGASEIKQMINDLLRAGRSEADVRIELINKYGAALQRRGS